MASDRDGANWRKPVDFKQINKRLAVYAKRYYGGQFAAPLPKELGQNPSSILTSDGFIGIQKHLPKGSSRKDFTGRKYSIAPHSSVITHIAREADAPMPEWLPRYNYVYSYVEDFEFSEQLLNAGFLIKAYRVSATSEIVACWCHAGEPVLGVSMADQRTFTKVDLPVPEDCFSDELEEIDCWHDDFPYYSDGTWSAVSLRGYKRDDPMWGVKPSEMPKKWREEHPNELDLKCELTVLSDKTPRIRAWVESISKQGEVERVRLFRMTAKEDKNGILKRHSDIQDRDVGTKNGMLARLHVPLKTHEDIKMTVWGLDGRQRSAHLAAGGVYYLDTRKPHSVANQSPVDRVHLVVDLIVNDSVRELICDSKEVEQT